MTTYKYTDFLENRQEYHESEKFWMRLFEEIFMECPEWKQWKKRLNFTLNDGTVIRDGNPIFSAISPSRNKYFRIVQLDPRRAERDFLSWIKFNNDGHMVELTIQCAISDATVKAVKEVLRKLVIEDASLDELQKIIEKHNEGSLVREGD